MAALEVAQAKEARAGGPVAFLVGGVVRGGDEREGRGGRIGREGGGTTKKRKGRREERRGEGIVG